MPTAARESASPEVITWLRRNAVALDGLSAGTGFADLAGFAGAFEGVRIAGLGESTHGTAEFFRLKHRLVEYLVTELGFTVIAMEASASAGPAVDAYIRYGVGEAADVLAGLGFWTWRTREVLELFEWLRGYNLALPEERRVRFVGVDPQRCGASVASVGGFLRESAPGELERELAALSVLSEADPGSRPDPSRALVRDAEAVLAVLSSRFAAETDVVEHARILVRAADLVTRERRHADFAETVFAARDRYMAEAVAEIVDADPSARVALWGHNGHIAKARYGGGIVSLGSRLRERFGAEYYALGLLFGEGVFRARRMWPWGSRPGRVVGNRVGPAPAGTVEADLACAAPGPRLLDLRDADGSAVMSEWLSATRMTRTYGAVVPRFVYRLNLAPTVVGEEFDGLAHVPVSTGSVPLPAR
ncbi:erythromycin esterase family protein [Phytomonospora sp. NPDC050363]|uniref:erythromycin esterase family protein n=1 Tax=Phytomonospora sp. NPDC050363 TaxID=3155642 RepID=UPI0033CBB02A